MSAPALLRKLSLLSIIGCAMLLAGSRAAAQSLFTPERATVPPEVERAYASGLKFLVGTQKETGAWDGQYGTEPAAVGLAIMAILAHGEDPNHGRHAAAVRRGLNFILENQKAENGYIGSSMYNHGFATLALAECYGAVDDARLGPALKAAVGLILSSQERNPYDAWRYSPEASDADSTVSGAQIVALFAARNAGLGVPEPALQKGLRFLLDCQSGDGGIGYTDSNGPNATRTAIGVTCLALARQQGSAPFKAAVDFLRAGGEADGSYFHYYLYYAAQAHFRMAPQVWEEWNAVNVKMLTETQLPDGSWEGQFGPTFSTAASLLSMALNYRLLPVYER